MKKNLLYITTKLPWPLIGGDKIHIYNYLKELKKRGHNITLVSFYSKDDDVISSLSKLQISRFADITLIISFEKVFNPKTRFSNWQPLLVGVK